MREAVITTAFTRDVLCQMLDIRGARGAIVQAHGRTCRSGSLHRPIEHPYAGVLPIELAEPVDDDVRVYLAPLLSSGARIGGLWLACDRAAPSPIESLLTIAVRASLRLAELGELAPALTPRQHEIALLVARGCTNPEIGRLLAISANAVKKHISRVLLALHVSNRTELAAIAGKWSVEPLIPASSEISQQAA